MSRIKPIEASKTDPKSAEMLAGFKAKMGIVPNLLATLAHSPAALGFYLKAGESLAGSALTTKFKEQLAVAIAEANSCDYCLSAHTAIGKMVGLNGDDLAAARKGGSPVAKDAAGLAFAQIIVRGRGQVDDAQLAAVRSAGYSEGEIAEIVAVVAVNTFTNYFNHIAQTDIDFPVLHTGR